jgi:ABC-type sugar transport system ATPase subunit
MPEMPALDCRGLTKSYSGVPVLRGVDLSAASGAVLGVAGENGAGKSTLMNLIGGVTGPDAGEMLVGGAPYRPTRPLDAAARGIAFVHQELNLFPNLSIADNLFLVSGRRAGAAALLQQVGLDLHPATPVERLSLAERQLVEIARAIGAHARILILDEPTTSLGRRDAERLFALVRDLTARGVAVIYISHALDDLLALSTELLVLRDGAVAASGPIHAFTRDRVISAMVGRAIDRIYPPKPGCALGPVVLEAAGVSQPGIVHDISFALRRGEVLGVAGLMGSGRSELARILFGLDPHARGEIRLDGQPIHRLSTRERIRRGLAFVTESRRDDGLFLDQGVDSNLTIVTSAAGPPDALIDRLRIRCSGPHQPVRQLSGGNQQKVALGKWLARPPLALILDEPTRGIDVAAKLEIYRAILDLAAAGAGVLVISSEIEELIGICHRIVVMRKGELRALDAGPFDREEILRAAL